MHAEITGSSHPRYHRQFDLFSRGVHFIHSSSLRFVRSHTTSCPIAHSKHARAHLTRHGLHRTRGTGTDIDAYMREPDGQCDTRRTRRLVHGTGPICCRSNEKNAFSERQQHRAASHTREGVTACVHRSLRIGGLCSLRAVGRASVRVSEQ